MQNARHCNAGQNILWNCCMEVGPLGVNTGTEYQRVVLTHEGYQHMNGKVSDLSAGVLPSGYFHAYHRFLGKCITKYAKSES